MDYHSCRFEDHSLLFFDEGGLVAALPANHEGNALFSHGGLTFGGILCGPAMKTPLMLKVFEALCGYMASHALNSLRYKVIPHIYHVYPTEEELYALFRYGARLVRRDVSSSLRPAQAPSPDSRRRRCLRKAERCGLEVRRSNEIGRFMELVAQVLRERHGVSPVHTPEEMSLLAGRFPENIKLYGAYRKSDLLAGVLVYESDRVAHAQYIASGKEGRDVFALDLIFNFLIRKEFSAKAWFDFGISTEDEGRFLNEGLVTFKEEFGARAVVYDCYELRLDGGTS